MASLLITIALIADVCHDLRRIVSGRSVVLLGIASWFLLEAVKLSPEVLTYQQDQYNFGVLCVVLATLAFLAGYHWTSGCKWFEKAASKVSILDDHRLLWRLVLSCSVIGFAPILFYSGLQLVDLLHGILGMRETWGGLIGRGRYGGFREAILQLENFVIGLAPFAVILLIDRRSSGFQRAFCAGVAAWPLLRGFGSGTRSRIPDGPRANHRHHIPSCQADYSTPDNCRRTLRDTAGLWANGGDRGVQELRRVLVGRSNEGHLRWQRNVPGIALHHEQSTRPNSLPNGQLLSRSIVRSDPTVFVDGKAFVGYRHYDGRGARRS